LQRLKGLKKATSGDVYGYKCSTGITLIAATFSETEPPLPHDPTLLLPASLNSCGSFSKDNKNADQLKQVCVVFWKLELMESSS